MKRAIKKETIATHYANLSKIPVISAEERTILEARFMSDGSIRTTLPALAEKFSILEFRLTSIVENAIEKIIAWSAGGGATPAAEEQGTTEREQLVVEADHYVTGDLGFVALLLTMGYNPDVKLTYENRADFTLRGDREEIAALHQDYRENAMQVDARAYFGAIHEIKQQVYELKNKPTVRDLIG